MLSILLRLNLIDCLFVMISGIMFLYGIKKGMVRTIFYLSTVVIALFLGAIGARVLAPKLAASFAPIVAGSLGLSDASNASVILGALQNTVIRTSLFTVIFLLVILVTALLVANTKVLDSLPKVKGFDILFGALCGVMLGLIVFLTVLYVFNHCGLIATNTVHSSFLLGKIVKFMGIMV